MRSPSTAMLWERWAGCRWWLIGGLAYFVPVAVICNLLPEGTAYSVVRVYLVVPLMVSPLGLIAMFVCGAHADVSSSDSLFPQRMFHLPLSTRALVGSSMLLGVSMMFLVCIALNTLALRTIRPDFPVLWPALLATACLAWLQVLAWAPFGMFYLRVVVGVPLLGSVLALPVLTEMLGMPSIVLVPVLAAQIPLAYVVATWSLARARRGDSPDWSWLIDWRRDLLGRDQAGKHSFGTANQAQRWLEWRRSGMGLTLGVLLATPFVAVLSLFTVTRAELPGLNWLCSPLCILAIPVMAAVSAGAEFGLFRTSPRESGPCAFLATRPLSSTDFVVAKLGTALRAVLICYAVALPAFLLATVLSGWQQKLLDGLLYLSGDSPSGAIGIALLTVLMLPALAWKFTVENMFVGLCGRKWVTSIAIPGLAAAFWLVPALGWWISHRPELLRVLIQAAPWLLAFLVVVKLLLAVLVYRVLKNRSLIETPGVRQAVAVWLAATFVLSVLALWLVPSELLPWHSAICGAVLTVPIVRLGLAPLALAWNRHR
jgi:hypothetical protein